MERIVLGALATTTAVHVEIDLSCFVALFVASLFREQK